MNGKQLKNSILQWAIQGKLVPQDSNDEPASVLLERIRAEKKRLIKEGKIKKNKNESIIFRGDDNSYYEKFTDGRVVCIDDEIPFEIPQNWEWARLGCIVEINPRNRADESSLAGFIPMTYIEAGYGNHFRFDVRKWKDLKSGFTHLADGDVAFAKITPCFQNRKSMILDDLPNGIAGGTTELNVLRVFGKTLNREYLLYFIKSHYFIGEAIFKGTAGQQRVRTGYTENKLIPIPPFSEQERIVGKINNVLPVVEKYELSQNHLDKLNSLIRERLKKSILQEAIQGKLAHQDSQEGDASELLSRIFEEKRKLLKEGKLKRKDLVESLIYKGEDNKYYEKVDGKVLDINEEIPFDIPESWSWVRLQQICTYIHRGKSPKYSEVKKFPVVAQKCNQWDGFHIEKAQFIAPESVSSYADENLLQDKDLLWNSTGLGTLGRIGLYPESSNSYGFAVADSHVTVIRTLPKFIRPEYLLLYFSSPTVQSVIEDKASGSTKQKELATETVKSYIVPIPPLAEQDRILDKYKTVLASWS